MTREVPLSLLIRQHLALKQEFARRHPFAWLVWEAGAWSLPALVDGNVARTNLPLDDDDLRDCLPLGDVLCFELLLSQPGTLRLGRAEANDVVIHDATVSREHALLTRDATGHWGAEAAPGHSVKLGDEDVPAGSLRSLAQGDRLGLGEIVLTFYDAESLLARVKDEGLRLLASVTEG